MPFALSHHGVLNSLVSIGCVFVIVIIELACLMLFSSLSSRLVDFIVQRCFVNVAALLEQTGLQRAWSAHRGDGEGKQRWDEDSHVSPCRAVPCRAMPCQDFLAMCHVVNVVGTRFCCLFLS